MSLGRKTLLIASLALAGLGSLIYGALTSILVGGTQDAMLVSYLTVSVVVAGGGFFLVVLLLMNGLVLTRLKRLNNTIIEISAREDFSQRLEIDGRDELAGLALEINGLLRSLQQSQSRPQGSQSLENGGDIFGAVFQAAPVLLALCGSEDGRLREVNQQFLSLIGLSREKVIGRTFAELELWADPPTQELWAKWLAEKEPVRESESRLRIGADGFRDTLASIAWVEVAGEPCWLFAACDITNRLNREVHLRQTQKMEAVGQLAAGFAHDLNNILAIVQGYTGLLLSDKGLESQAGKALREIGAASERAAGLTRQLLIFSRKQFMQPKILDLNRLLQGLENSLQRLLGESSAVKFSLSPEAPPVRADATMMEQMIVNLAVNARESMPRGGQLSVSTAPVQIDAAYVRQTPDARPGRFTSLTVADTGCGFDTAHLNRLFEPFYSAKGSTKGMGLGLATVYGIVKQHQGWIEVNSQSGRGTTFKIFLPSENRPVEPAKPPPPGLPTGQERILLVEDEPGLCLMVEGILRRCGYRVSAAPNGMAALELWKQQKGEFDLLLTDMVMPEGLTGRQLGEKLKAQKPSLRVIYSSGYSVDLVSEEGMELSEGLNFLQKPYHPQKLAQTVRSCLDTPAEKPALAEALA